MSTRLTQQEDGSPGVIRYEVSASDDAVGLTIQSGGGELSVSTDPESALLLASDIIAAVDNATDASEGSREPLVFER